MHDGKTEIREMQNTRKREKAKDGTVSKMDSLFYSDIPWMRGGQQNVTTRANRYTACELCAQLADIFGWDLY